MPPSLLSAGEHNRPATTRKIESEKVRRPSADKQRADRSSFLTSVFLGLSVSTGAVGNNYVGASKETERREVNMF